ncbi:MAG: response regulator transcription factor [Deltaproteobacteria bacterium]|nr:response regulator transcription factor [Deltaproteobacteria bacterium]
MSKTRILIIDDHQLLSSGLAMLLCAEKDLEVTGQADRPETALRLAEEQQPDILLLDISLPGRSGLDLLPELLARSPQSRVIMMTMHEEQQYLKKAIEGGAKGFVLKKGGGTDLMYAIRAVMQGDTYIQPSMLADFIKTGEESSEGSPENLSEDEQRWRMLSQREQQIVLGVAKGYTSREMAEGIFLSEKTVATYRSRAMTKLGFESRADLVEFVLRLRKIDI